ncbi:MAG: SEC-C domain-containing protein [Burkholderiales bacterium]|nr:SEC-C domain-containing protein [Burkholderiales bacterium]
MSAPRWSFVVCSIDAGKFASLTASVGRSAGGDHEIVGIHDARSLAEGWTRGLARARADRIVFCHDDIEFFVPDLLGRLDRHLGRHDLVGLAGTRRCVGMDWSEAGIEHAAGAIVHDADGRPEFCFYGAGDADHAAGGLQAMDGVLLATHRDIARSVGFDADTFDGFHGYDADFTFRSHGAGWKLAAALDIPVVHRSRGRPDAARMRYHLRFAGKYADRIVNVRGPWVHVRVPIEVPGGIAAAFDPANLARLHRETRAEAARLEREASRPYAAPRNAPCPCGSGLKYKDCHGRAAGRT